MGRSLQYHDFRRRVHVPERVDCGVVCNPKRFNESQSLGYPGGENMG